MRFDDFTGIFCSLLVLLRFRLFSFHHYKSMIIIYADEFISCDLKRAGY